MIPAGYMLKKVCSKPDWISASGIKNIYSVSGCISEYFADYIGHWRHNGYWLFNSPADVSDVAEKSDTNRSELTLFYYEVHEQQFDEQAKVWSAFEPDAAFPTDVEKPPRARLQGYDVTSFSAGTMPECSPLSCNSLANDIAVNEHCLFATFQDAKSALESGRFDNSEPGPFRIFAVYTVED